MKRFITLILILITVIASATSLSSCHFGDNGGTGDIGGNGGNSGNVGNKGDDYVPDCSVGDHLDENNDEYCDICNKYVIVVIDFYVLNDLHGKFCDTPTQPGVDELGTYLKQREEIDDNVVILSSGDMWQGTAESNLTSGFILTEWMNEMNFVSMTLGNHEFDWGEDDIRANLEIAEFPFLAINIYDNNTNQLVDYCTPSVMVERDGIKIGIIGAIGDCYSSISADMVEGVHFKVGSALTNLVKAESERLRSEGADLIVYSLHDGYGSNKSSTSIATPSQLSEYYDSVLSSGYVDLVFEGHTHKHYTLVDTYDVYHLQGGGENAGLSHVEISVNAGNGSNKVRVAEFVRSSAYSSLTDDPATEALEDKYGDVIDYAYAPLGTVSNPMSDYEVEDTVAALYLKKGIEKWGDEYDIVLGGGFLRTRAPYQLSSGVKTYADILSLLPFDNRLVLCSVSGSKLKDKFIYSSNTDYHIALSEYGRSIENDISNNKTYYVIVDTYTSLYSPNGLTVVDYYDNKTFARDLLAEAIMAGEFEIKQDDFQLTSIQDALIMGGVLADNQETSEYYYISGTLKENPNSTYGNVYLVDDDGNEIYIYGLYDMNGNRYDSMSNKPYKGDRVIVYSRILKYVNATETKIELKNAILIEIK